MAETAHTSGQSTISLLAADGPAEGVADRLMLFGHFVGAWDVESTSFQPDGTRLDQLDECLRRT
jgi:hypothetical protein